MKTVTLRDLHNLPTLLPRDGKNEKPSLLSKSYELREIIKILEMFSFYFAVAAAVAIVVNDNLSSIYFTSILQMLECFFPKIVYISNTIHNLVS